MRSERAEAKRYEIGWNNQVAYIEQLKQKLDRAREALNLIARTPPITDTEKRMQCCADGALKELGE